MKLSIITINYNNREGLRKTLESVKIQTTREFEYIVIDGGSTDGSVDVIKEYADIIDHWVSEPDKGIYNAMNKGVAAAHGEYCNFLNSGDTLHNSHIVEKFYRISNTHQIMIGISRLVYYDGAIITKEILDYPPEEILTDRLLVSSIGHGPAFIKRNLLIRHPYDENLKIVSDWKFYIESLILNKASYCTLDFIVDDFDMSGCSNTQIEKRTAERNQVLQELFPIKLINDYISLLYGRTKLERMIRNQRTNGLFYKIMTLIATILLIPSKLKRI